MTLKWHAGLVCVLWLGTGCSEAPRTTLAANPPDASQGFVDPTTVGVGGDLSGVDPAADTDGDGVPDVQEGTGDANGNGVPAHRDVNERGNTPSVPPLETGSGVAPMRDAGGAADEDAGCGAVSEKGAFERAPVDVIWAIDSSGSMFDEAATIAANIGTFVTTVEGSGANIRVVMLALLDPATGSALAQDPERYRFQFTNVDSHNSFEQILAGHDSGGLFGGEGYAGFLRPGAATHVIVVTDDSSFMAGSEFQTQMEAKLGHEFFFHAIASDEACGLGINTGSEYFALANVTGGEELSICAPDWSVVFERLQSAVVATAAISCEIGLPANDKKDLNNVQVVYTGLDGTSAQFPKADDAGQCGDAQGWAYDDPNNPTQVVLCPAACDAVKAGGDLAIVFACEPPPPLI